MMARFTMRCITLFSVLLLALAIGCGDDRSMTSNDDTRENNQNGPPDDLNEESQLLHHDSQCDTDSVSCPRPGQVGTNMDISVRLTNSDGDPIEFATISFKEEHISGASGVDLSGRNVPTDSNGVAQTTVRIPEDPSVAIGTLEVIATVADDDRIDERIFNVGISSKTAAAYVIEFTHEGQSRPDRVRPLLLDSDYSCAEARDDFFTDRSWPSAEWQLTAVNVNPDGSVNPAILNEVPNNEQYTIIGVGEEEVGNQYVQVAHGCVDDASPIIEGVNVHVEVFLNDHIPHLNHRYDMTHDFDLTGALPSSVTSIIDLISTLVNDPAAFVLGCPEENSSCPDGGQYGLVDMIMDFDFIPDNLKNQVDQIRESFVFIAGLDWLSDYLTDLLPDWLQGGFVATADIISMLEEFTVEGRMYFEEQPVPELQDGQAIGRLYEANSYQIWDTLVFEWNLGCDDDTLPADCSRVEVSANDLGPGLDHSIEGAFSGTVYGSTALEIDRHPLTLHYGLLLIGVIENIVLPRIFNDDNVNSLDALIGEIIDCEDLASQLTDNASLQGAASDLCDQLSGQATAAIYEWVGETLVAEGDEHFQLRTPSSAPCELYQLETPSSNWPGSPLPYIESLGQPESGMRCEWNTEINYSGGAEPDIAIIGQFTGSHPDN